MSKVIMVQGTMSNVGKSVIVAGLCRIMKQDGYMVAPFKSQNMALNSFITHDGLEMGRAQVMQAEAAGVRPDVCMNPVLLKPTDDTGSQVIINGTSIGNMSARDYFAYKKNLIPDIKKAFLKLSKDSDIIVIEGAGSPAEINLKEDDIVNMGLATMLNAPVLLAGDIDRGGVFAQLLGTIDLLDKNERDLICGLIINKFRGDKSLLDSGIEILEKRGKIPVCGVLPYLRLMLDDEDSLTTRFDLSVRKTIDIAVIRFPRISNFTDLNIFEQSNDVSVRYVNSLSDLGSPDMIVLPGSKNTIDDLVWMRENHIADKVIEFSKENPVFGICGGYQMLGISVSDPFGSEANAGEAPGLGLLPIKTVIQQEKTREQKKGIINRLDGFFEGLSGLEYKGYEIHMGESTVDGEHPSALVSDGRNVCGTYVHGIFDRAGIADAVVSAIAKKKGIKLGEPSFVDNDVFKDRQYDKLADSMREHLDMKYIYSVLREADCSL